MIDADGLVDWTLNLFARHLTDNAVVIIDDYALWNEKGSLTRPVVDRLCELGYLEKWSVIKWTWIGSATEAHIKNIIRRHVCNAYAELPKSGLRKISQLRYCVN